MSDYNISDTIKSRLTDVASKHNLGTAESLADQFVMDGLKAYEAPDGSQDLQLERLVAEQEYSSVDEAVEHLLVRGLREYEESTSTPEESEARVSGIGHID